jgi:hypothetical protein
VTRDSLALTASEGGAVLVAQASACVVLTFATVNRKPFRLFGLSTVLKTKTTQAEACATGLTAPASIFHAIFLKP